MPITPDVTTYANRDLDEVVAAWPAWALAAEAVDEPELAHRLWESAPPYGIPPHEVDLGRARSLVLLGRFPEALDRLQRMADPSGAVPGDSGNVLLAAAHAGCGNDGAYQFLLASCRQGATAVPAEHLRLLAVVAEHRGATMDVAWARTVLLEVHGAATPAAVAAYAASGIAARDPDSDAGVIVLTVRLAADALQGLHPPVAVQPDAVLAAASQLDAQGDRAGARLLLRAIDVVTPGVKPVREAIRHLTPVARMRVAALLAVLAFAAVEGTFIVLAAMLDIPHLRLGGIGVLLVAGWARMVPLPGLTRAESQAWRQLAKLVDDPTAPGRTEATKPNTGLWGLGGIIGATAGIPLAINLTADGAPLGTGPDGAPPVVLGLVTWLVLIGGLGTVGALAVRALDLGRAERRGARREAARVAEMVAAATQCACGMRTALTGSFAAVYTDAHLAPDRRAATPAITHVGGGAALLARCRSTGALWLYGPVGRGGQWLALNGLQRSGTPSTGLSRRW